MTKTFLEILLFVSVAVNAALLLFIAGVLGKIMSEMSESAFKDFLDSLYRHSTKSIFMIITLTIPFIGMIPYFFYYGFDNWWITSGLVLWLVAGGIAKMIKVPVFKKIMALTSSDTAELAQGKKTLQMGNTLQAILNAIATVLMGIGLFF